MIQKIFAWLDRYLLYINTVLGLFWLLVMYTIVSTAYGWPQLMAIAVAEDLGLPLTMVMVFEVLPYAYEKGVIPLYRSIRTKFRR